MNDRTFHASGAHRLDDPERRRWLPPGELIRLLELSPGMDVADVGAGTGFFALPIAAACSEGTVYAVDLQPEMLRRLEARLGEAPGTIRLVEGDAARTTLPDRCADRVLLANVWHELDDHPAALREAARVLRPEGWIAILDWSPEAAPPPGPPVDHRIGVGDVTGTLEAEGWVVRSAAPFGPYSYLVLAEAQ